MTPTPKSTNVLFFIEDLERLEFTGVRLPDGTIKAFGCSQPYEDWPKEITVAGEGNQGTAVKFRLEESEDRSGEIVEEDSADGSPAGSLIAQAWYVPA